MKNRLPRAACLLVLTLSACDSDTAEDATEQDNTPVDSDGDGLTDTEEAELGSDPQSSDSDGDGLDDAEELELGTDPTLSDTDTDGLSDSVELDAGSDPLNMFSWPGGGVWPDRTAAADSDGINGDDYALGAVFPNFKGSDRYDELVELYQFYGHVILLDFSAGWCGPCQVIADDAEALWNEHREDGLVIIHAMVSDYNQRAADQAFLEDWADQFGLTFPVLGGNRISSGPYSGLAQAGLNTYSIPYLLISDKDMTLDNQYSGSGSEAELAAELEGLLGD
jgi:thiol-disulfide isomerase/thioredoxin